MGYQGTKKIFSPVSEGRNNQSKVWLLNVDSPSIEKSSTTAVAVNNSIAQAKGN